MNTRWILAVWVLATCLDSLVKSTVDMSPMVLPMIQTMSTLVICGRFRWTLNIDIWNPVAASIAHDAADHSPYSPFSHFDAHFETYVEEYDRDTDDPIVENLTSIFYTGGYDWLITVFGPSIVIVDAAAIDDGEEFRYRGSDMWKMPSEHVIDTMEAVMDADSGDYKRLHSSLDSGFQYVSGTYTGESVRRVMENGRLIDTDNSTEDYYVTEAIGDCGTGL